MALCAVLVALMWAGPLGALTRPTVYPTPKQVASFLEQGAATTSIPSGDILPGIGVPGSVDLMAPHPNWSECSVMGPDISVTPETIAHCTFGDPNASVAIGVYGDSNAAMWAPAFDIYGVAQHRRIIVLAHMGCTTWPRPWAPSKPGLQSAISESSCAVWRSNVLSAFRRARVTYVVPISIDTSAERDFVKTSKMINSMTVNIRQIRALGMRPMLVTPVPRYPAKTDYLNCLSVHSSSLASCMIATSSVPSNRLNTIFTAVSRSETIPMIPTTDLFCAVKKCPLFVSWEGRTIQLYRDGQHITAAYAQLIAGALGPRITIASTHAR